MPSAYLQNGKAIIGYDKNGKPGLLQCCCQCWVVKSVTKGGSGSTWCISNVEDKTGTLNFDACRIKDRFPTQQAFIDAARTAANFMLVHTTDTIPGVEHRCWCEGDVWMGGIGNTNGGSMGGDPGDILVTTVATDKNNQMLEVRVTFTYDVCLKMDAPWRSTHEFYVVLRWRGTPG